VSVSESRLNFDAGNIGWDSRLIKTMQLRTEYELGDELMISNFSHHIESLSSSGASWTPSQT
jgi:hypothetical protein